MGCFIHEEKILLTTLVLTILVGCNNDETEEENLDDVTMTQEKVEQKNDLQYDKFKMEDDTLYLKNGDEESEVTLTHSDDVLIKQKTSTNSTYEARDYKDKKDAEKKLIEENEALKKNQDGVEYNLDLRDKDFTETLTIDYENADLNIVANIPEDEDTEGIYISYAQMKDTLFMRGYYTEGEATANFEGQEDIEGTGTIERKDNEVIAFNMDVILPYESQELTKDEAVEQFTPLQEYYKEMSKKEGIDLSLTFEDNGMHFKQNVDYKEANVEDVFKIEHVDETPTKEDLKQLKEYSNQVEMFSRYGLLYKEK